MAVTIYGIKTCDTMKKAFSWLDKEGRAYRFHDYRAEGLDEPTLRGWVSQVGWEKLLNKASTTFRELPASEKAALDGETAVQLMLTNPTMIKRPVLDVAGRLTVGFKPETYAQAMSG
jgi:Spx/MgsR family transcriptional regulator